MLTGGDTSGSSERIAYQLSAYRPLLNISSLNFQAVLSGPQIAHYFTIGGFSTGLIPASTAIQIRRGQKAGTLVFPCTGTGIPGFSFYCT
jgi:hypothetical protein